MCPTPFAFKSDYHVVCSLLNITLPNEHQTKSAKFWYYEYKHSFMWANNPENRIQNVLFLDFKQENRGWTLFQITDYIQYVYSANRFCLVVLKQLFYADVRCLTGPKLYIIKTNLVIRFQIFYSMLQFRVEVKNFNCDFSRKVILSRVQEKKRNRFVHYNSHFKNSRNSKIKSKNFF